MQIAYYPATARQSQPSFVAVRQRQESSIAIAPPVTRANGMRVPADIVAVRNVRIMKHPAGWIDNVKSYYLSITFWPRLRYRQNCAHWHGNTSGWFMQRSLKRPRKPSKLLA